MLATRGMAFWCRLHVFLECECPKQQHLHRGFSASWCTYPVLKHCTQPPHSLRNLPQLLRLPPRRHKRLLYNDMLPLLQRHLREVEVAARYRRHNNDIDLLILQHLLAGAPRLDAGEVLGSVIVGSRVPLDDAVEVQCRNGHDERDVEDLGREAVAY